MLLENIFNEDRINFRACDRVAVETRNFASLQNEKFRVIPFLYEDALYCF